MRSSARDFGSSVSRAVATGVLAMTLSLAGCGMESAPGGKPSEKQAVVATEKPAKKDERKKDERKKDERKKDERKKDERKEAEKSEASPKAPGRKFADLMPQKDKPVETEARDTRQKPVEPKPSAPAKRLLTKPSPRETKREPQGGGSIVHPGSFCSTSGATGVTKKGTSMVCKEAKGGRLRWGRA